MGKKLNYFIIFLIGAAFASFFILYPPATIALVEGATFVGNFAVTFVTVAPAQFFTGAILAGLLVFTISKGYLGYLFGGTRKLKEKLGGTTITNIPGQPAGYVTTTSQTQSALEKKEAAT